MLRLWKDGEGLYNSRDEEGDFGMNRKVMKGEGRMEEIDRAEWGGCGWESVGRVVLKGGRVSSSQSSPEAEGRLSHSMNSHPCFLLPVPGYEEDMETVSSIFIVSSFPLPTTIAMTFSPGPYLYLHIPTGFPECSLTCFCDKGVG